MNKKDVMERLENVRLNLNILKPFKGKAGVEKTIHNHIQFLKTHKADEIAHLFVKEVDSNLVSLKKIHPDRADDIDSVLRVCRGELVLTGTL